MEVLKVYDRIEAIANTNGAKVTIKPINDQTFITVTTESGVEEEFSLTIFEATEERLQMILFREVDVCNIASQELHHIFDSETSVVVVGYPESE